MHYSKFINLIVLAASLSFAQQQTPSSSPPASAGTTQQQSQPEQKSVPGIGVSVQDQPQSGEKPQRPQDTEIQPAQPKAQDEQQPAPEQKMTKEQADELFRSLDEIIAFDSKSTGLPQKHPVKKQLTSRDEVEKFIETRMKEDKDAKRLERSELVLKKLGLVPRDFQLRPFLIALLKEQVAGYYDSKTKTVYLLDWLTPEAQKPVMAHELMHALQDQNFDIEKFAKEAEKKKDIDSDERLVARQAVTEGQAMIALMDYVLSPVGKDVQSDPGAVDAMMAAMRDGASTPKLAEAPAYLRDVLIFPYNWGMDFVRTVLVRRGKDAAFTGLFHDPPHDSREIMEPEAYLNGQHLAATKVPDFEKAIGNGYKKWDVSGLGEFDIWEIAKLYSSEDAAKKLANGYRGAYSYVAAKGNDPKTTADMSLVLVTQWSSAEMAERFAKMWGISVGKRYNGAKDQGNGAWMTADGPVSIERKGDTVLVVESFDEQAAAKARAVVFGQKAASAAAGK
jgi:hypothetical protein